jgi:hypothetical protein
LGAFDDTAFFDVETGDDAFGEHGGGQARGAGRRVNCAHAQRL